MTEVGDKDLARLDYDQTTHLVRALTDVRFRLLAFVPTIAGAAVAFLSDPGSASALVAVGLLGLVATLGIFVYELRNSQLYDAALHRAEILERRLGFRSIADEARIGGVFAERPGGSLALFGRVAVRHDRGIALVYAAALGGWTYLVGWGLLALGDVPGAQSVGAVAGAVAAAFVVYEAARRDGRTGDPSRAS